MLKPYYRNSRLNILSYKPLYIKLIGADATGCSNEFVADQRVSL
jgi:hypothetical protein